MQHASQNIDTRNKKRKQSLDTRALIIEAACDILSDEGYKGFTASALVKQSGISKGGIYHHFDNMDEVLLAAYQESTREIFTPLGSHTPESFDDYMANVEKLLFDSLFKKPKTMRIMHELLPRALYDSSFGAKQEAFLGSGIERGVQCILDSFGEKISKAELKIILKSVSIFISGLALHLQMTGNLSECKKMWSLFRKTLSEHIDKP